MKSKLQTLVVVMLFIPALLFCQTPSPYSAFLNISNYNALVYSESSFFWDHIGSPQFEIPISSGKSTVFCHDIWIGGFDPNDGLHLAAQKYMAGGKDYFFGPVADTYDNNYDSRYNMVWKVNKTTIDNHILNYGSAGYTVPSSIAEWPGNGDVSNGEPAYLAPYVDVNTNGIYDPDNGDYPYIKGDQALYVIFNDARDSHMESGGNSLGFDIHCMVYAYYTSNVVNNAFFISYKIINRSQTDYHDLRLGMFTDFDLGYAFDDYIGCDSTRNMYFAYNGDATDGDGTGSSYGASPPAQGVVILNKPMDNFIYFNNSSGTTGEPDATIEYYNFLQSKWKDGAPFTYGGTGYGGTVPTNFMFSGDINNPTEWTEVAEGNTPGDRRGLAGIEVGNFVSGEEFCFDIAFVWGRTLTLNQNESVDILKASVDSVQNFFDSNNLGCQWWPSTSAVEVDYYTGQMEIYPNPVSEIVHIQTENDIQEVVLTDITGKIVLRTNKMNIDVSNLLPGLYLIRITTDKSYSAKQLIVK